MKSVFYFIASFWLIMFTLAMAVIPRAKEDLVGKSVVIHQDTLMITKADDGGVLHLSNGAEITVELVEKHLID